MIAREDNPGDKRLVAYYVPRADQAPDVDALRAHISKNLPDFMVPSHFVELARFPLTPNAKVDRKALPKPDQSATRGGARAGYVEAGNELEKGIAKVWMTILGLSKVGTHDNFFELGGHSLLAVQAHREIRQVTGKDLTITDIFRFPTIAGLAAFLGGGGDADGGATLDKTADRAAARREAMRNRAAARKR